VSTQEREREREIRDEKDEVGLSLGIPHFHRRTHLLTYKGKGKVRSCGPIDRTRTRTRTRIKYI
jgi:hypothetical protein